jgi:ATP-binding cassette, subfamily B, bacterial MsbA
MKHIKILILKEWKLFLIVFITAIIASILEGLGISYIFPVLENSQSSNVESIPYPFRYLPPLFTGMGMVERLRIVAGLLVITIFTKSIFLYLNSLISSKIQIAATRYFRFICFDQMMNIGIGYINSKKAGELQTIFGQYNQVMGQFVNTIGLAVPKLFNLLIYVAMAFLLSWQMTTITGVLALFASLMMKKLMTKANKVGEVFTEANARFNGISFELITAIKFIRLFAREKGISSIFQKEVKRLNRDFFQVIKVNTLVQPAFETITILSLAFVIIAGSIFLMGSENILTAKLAVFLVVFQRISYTGSILNQYRVNIHSIFPTLIKVSDFLKTDDKQILPSGNGLFIALSKNIQLQNVHFKYPNSSNYVLRNVNITIEKNSRIGIVGSSGAGKSTFTELLLRFYDPNEGSILIDGVDLKHLDILSFRRKIGLVSQDIFLLNGTINENIAFGNPTASIKEIENAAKRAYAFEFIKELPNKFDSIIGDRGVLLSGGQKQRIAIARAILIDPDIFIFDEATSALDSESERIVQSALNEVSHGKTTVTIAHRLSTVFNADKIFVMDSGTIVEEGTHQELLKRKGIYSKLVNLQQLD